MKKRGFKPFKVSEKREQLKKGKKIMIIKCDFEGIVLATVVKEGKEGKKYYNASLFDPSSGEVGVLGMSEEAYASIKPDITKAQKLYGTYNDTYKAFRIIGKK